MLVRKRPVEVEAFRWDGSEESALVIINWAKTHDVQIWYRENIHPDTEEGLGTYHLTIHTLEGDMIARPGYWIIKGVENEFYGCEPEIFGKTYEESLAVYYRAIDTLLKHQAYPVNSVNCMCGWRPALMLNDTESDRAQRLTHVAEVLTGLIGGEGQ
jgi:hypothetical protein